MTMKNKKKHFKKASPKKSSSATKEEKKKFWMSIALITIMVSSVFGVVFYGFSSGMPNRVEYGEYSFIPQGNVYLLNLDRQQLMFPYVPQELEHIDLSEDMIDTLRNSRQIILTSNYSSPAQADIANSQFFFKQTVDTARPSTFVDIAFTTEHEVVPQITCTNASSYVSVIVYELSDTTEVTHDNGCIVIHGQGIGDFIPLTTRLLYGLLGIMR
jgi:hypothetical protein